MPNQLANETSPYLLQHQDNPVDWRPWGAAALARARAEDRPIFLSIGYAACHWCHVMAHESFEDPATAALMNEHFVNIKVDREERPDLDSIYMNAVVALTGQGGWPMSVFLTPDGVPFYGGTYFPPAPRHGLPSFSDVLRSVSEAWRNRRDEIEDGGQNILQHISRDEFAALNKGASQLSIATLDEATKAVWNGFDWRNAGWGGAPKFPQPMTLEFLLRQHHRTGDPLALEMVEKTLTAMAAGGMYDQLGGGFHRYSVDDHWLVPHFEKMLYDNAQLARVYLHAYQVTGKARYRTVVEEICDYVLREMTDPGGGFYSTQDADSEGVEGKFFVWTPDQVREALETAGAAEDADVFLQAYDVSSRGNFEGNNILNVRVPLAALAEHFGADPVDIAARLANARRILWRAREERVKPGLDDKILAGWNGLMLAALAEAARVLERADYRAAAERNGSFLLDTMRNENGRLWRTVRGGGPPKLNGYLEDYANVIDGLIEVYQTTFRDRWIKAALELAQVMVAHFADEDGPGFFDTSDDHESLVTRPRSIQDNATPSGSAMAAGVLFKLAAYTGDGTFYDRAAAACAPMQAAMQQHPTAFAQWLQALSFALDGPVEIAIVGPLNDDETRELLAEVQLPYRPHQVTALLAPGATPVVELLADRAAVDGKATAYVCRNFTCRLPVTEPEDLRAQLERAPFEPTPG
ncbi:MAG: thioredoxin domain-containing protein [Anaerolineales bacterium]